MGMTIDESVEWLVSRKEHYEMDDNCQELAQALDTAIDTMRKYQQLQADYEARLKADMVSMLTAIQLEIREYHEIGCDEDCNNCRMVGCVEPVNVIKDLDIIQQKIDALKGEQA